MMKEEDDLDFPLTPEMADVEFVLENGPNSTVRLAASSDSSTNKENEKGITASVQETEELCLTTGDAVSESDKNNLSEAEKLTENSRTIAGLEVEGKSDKENIPVSETSNSSYAADKSKELFGDSEGDGAFGILQEKKVIKSNSAAQLFEGSDTKEYIGDGSINESFEMIGVTKSMENQEEQGSMEANSFEKVLYTDVTGRKEGGSIESSFEALSITNSITSSSQSLSKPLQAPFVNENPMTLAANIVPGIVNRSMTEISNVAGYQTGNYQQIVTSYSNQMVDSPVYHPQQPQFPQQGHLSNFDQQSSTIDSVSSTQQIQGYTSDRYQQPQQALVQNNQFLPHGIQNPPLQTTIQTAQGTPSYQNQVPMMTAVQQGLNLYNSQVPTSIPLYNPGGYNSGASSQDSLGTTYPNTMVPTADVGNSYMYTSPISSVTPEYNTAPNSVPFVIGQQSPIQPAPQQASGLFVPDLYGHPSTPASKVDIFIPAAPVLQVEPQPPSMNYNNSPNNYPQSSPHSNYKPEMSVFQPAFQPIPLSMPHSSLDASHQDPGLLDWVKRNMNQDWGEGAKKLGQQIIEKTKNTIGWFGEVINDGGTKLHLPAAKNATETVLTTLDPGMEEYLNPVMNLAIASSDTKILNGMRQGFRCVFGHTAARGHVAQHSLASLPIGFDAGVRATKEQLDVISNINFQFNGAYVAISAQEFLTELEQGKWSCMFCIALRDLHRRIELHSFSQPISIPTACVSIAYNKTHPDEIQQKLGYNVTIDDAVRLYKPYPPDQDWCSTLTGMTIESLLASASQGLAADYRREIENPSMNSTDSISILQ